MDSNTTMENILAAASFYFSQARPLIPMYIHLILSAMLPIYTGAHASLSRPSSAAKPEKKADKSTDSDDEDESEDKIQKMEGMSNKDAIVLPITAGLVLAGLYYLIMEYGADLINLILGWYFSGIGVYSVGKFVNDGLELGLNFIFPSYYACAGSAWRVSSSARKLLRSDSKAWRAGPDPVSFYAFPLPLWSVRQHLKQKHFVKAYVRNMIDLRAKFTIVNFCSALVGVATIVYVNTVSKHWILTNLQGFAVSYAALQIMSPTTFPTGNLILIALFCYDVWAVFFTPLMVTVAKNLDQPIKLVFPRPDEPAKIPGAPPTKAYSMLGLGDIVLPGIIIGLALRFDLHMYYAKKQKKSQKTEIDSDGNSSIQEIIEKAPYVTVTGHWGDRFWTCWLPANSLPAQLRSSFPKPYFTASMVGYLMGMLTTLGVMSVFQHAQPALLYLVPGVLISLWGAALIRGELKEMWEFSEALTGEQLEDDGDMTGAGDSSGEQQQKGLFERLWQEIWGDATDGKPTKSPEGEDERAATPKESKKASDEDAKVSEKKDEDGHDVLFYITVSQPGVKGASYAHED